MPETAYFPPLENEAYFRKRPGVLLLLGGLATTAATLALLYALDQNGVHVMGWYADFVLPVGALLAGAVAGSGYGLAAWLSGVRVRKSLLWAIAALQLAAYFSAQYLEYEERVAALAPNAPVSFFEYYDAMTRSFAWKDRANNGQPGKPLEGLGYLLRLAEILGFIAGGMAAPAILRTFPYCEACQAYRRTKILGVIPASAVTRKVKKKDAAGQEAYTRENQAEYERAIALGAQALALVEQANATELAKLLAEHAGTARSARKRFVTLKLSTECCSRCQSGRLALSQIVQTGGSHANVQATEIGSAPFEAAFYRNFMLAQADQRRSGATRKPPT